ncbi:mitochondrial carrier domain-containing protein, partial [Dimargaris cristalligena]
SSSHPNLKHTIAGAGAGCVSAIVTCPLDVVKTRLQNQGRGDGITPLYRGTLHTLRRIGAEEGIRGLYRGLGPTVMGYLPTWAIYFSTYDALKVQIARRLNRSIDHPLVHILSATGAGATSSMATNPLWVIKTRFMTQNERTAYRYNNTLHAFQSILRTEGVRGLYKGLGSSFLGLSHVVVHFPLYEKLKLWLKTIPAFSNDSEPPHAGLISFRSSLGTSGENQRGTVIASALSKLTASVITYPHEVIRTRLQNQSTPPYRYHGIVHAIRTIFHEEGWRAFYRGLPTNLIRTVPASAVTLLTYELLVKYL